jgi:small conductance mechanosensitive channel
VDVDAVQDTILATAVDLAQNTKWRSRIVEKPEIWGLESISADALVIRLAMKTRSSSKDDVARELRIRLKKNLDEMGVHLPALNTPVLAGFEGAGSITGSRPPKTRPLPVSPAAPHAPRAGAPKGKE